jgi:hypothetical protein
MTQRQFDFDGANAKLTAAATEQQAAELIADGESRRNVGMALAAARRPDNVSLGRLAMVRALLRSPDETATIDDATGPEELAAEFVDGGRWRGTVTRSLVTDGLAEIIGTTRSRRPSRHRGYVARLRLTDRTKAELYLRRMSAAMALYDATPNAATNGVAGFPITMQTENLNNATN